LLEDGHGIGFDDVFPPTGLTIPSDPPLRAWTDNGDGTYTVVPGDPATVRFSDLDLYLMGSRRPPRSRWLRPCPVSLRAGVVRVELREHVQVQGPTERSA
jgi:hypothetical protein